ncbi:MAG: SsrA-binding protein SmpB [Opitutales bacterium]
MSAKKKKGALPGEVRNTKLHFKYAVEEKIEAGIVLQGTEVKAIRAGDAQITEAFARINQGEVFLYNAHIQEYVFGNTQNHKPTRPRKLLLHRKEIDRVRGALEAGGKTLVPSRLYLKNGLVKVELALCKGKKLHDKRDSMKKKLQLREAERAMKAYAR